MDDLQFRRSIYADPNSQDNDMLSAQVDDDKKIFRCNINGYRTSDTLISLSYAKRWRVISKQNVEVVSI